MADGWNRFWFTPSDPYPLGLIRLLTGCLATFLHLTLLPDVGRLFAAGGWLPQRSGRAADDARRLGFVSRFFPRRAR